MPQEATALRISLRPMSARGHSQAFGEPKRKSALPPRADIKVMHRHVCFGPAAEVGAAAFDEPASAGCFSGTVVDA